MQLQWSAIEATLYVNQHQAHSGATLAQLAYATALLGQKEDLALHGGGNTSCKDTVTTITGEQKPALFVKASGYPLSNAKPSDFVALDQTYLASLSNLCALSDEEMADEFGRHLLKRHPARPSIETLMHAFIAAPIIMHTHPTAILALTNRKDGRTLAAKVLGNRVVVIPYARVGFDLATAVASAIREQPACDTVIIMHHGIVCFGKSVQEVYARTIECVTCAEKYLSFAATSTLCAATALQVEKAHAQYRMIAPCIRGALSPLTSDNPDERQHRVLHHLVSQDILAELALPQARALFETVPLTPDYLIRTRTLPLFMELPESFEPANFADLFTNACAAYTEKYQAYIAQHAGTMQVDTTDLLPRVVIIPGIGAICAGANATEAAMVADITRQALAVKTMLWQSGGTYEGLSDDHLFDMEYRTLQRAKIALQNKPMTGRVALVTGSAGAIGSGVCRALCEAGCHVVVTDLANEALVKTAAALREEYGNLVAEVALDVTDPASVSEGFGKGIDAFGGIDCVIVNAGIAHVAPLVQLELEAFRKLERVNVEGTLLILAEAMRHCTLQDIGGDIVLISTKNVFAPGAQFGAYSATKAASHQLARIASLEGAPMGIRVNMVAPDAVFSHGDKKSGLWAAVGPNRMKARGLDEKGLEDYYQSRNLLKARIGADHVAKAVLFFVTRQTPTTGATIPVDGGLPDATPR